MRIFIIIICVLSRIFVIITLPALLGHLTNIRYETAKDIGYGIVVTIIPLAIAILSTSYLS